LNVDYKDQLIRVTRPEIIDWLPNGDLTGVPCGGGKILVT